MKSQHIIDVKEKLNNRLLREIDVIDVTETLKSNESIPTLNELLKYNAILLYSHNTFFRNSERLGNILADYVDLGGGVVVCCYACCGCFLSGRWKKEKYDPLSPMQSCTGVNMEMKKIYQPDHPILSRINSITGHPVHTTLYSPGKINKDAIVIAEWSNGAPLIIEKKTKNSGGNIVTLNFLPCSTDVYQLGWCTLSQGDILLINALLYVSGFFNKEINF